MVAICQDYDQRGYCLKGRECAYNHGTNVIELDVSGYGNLIDAMQMASARADTLTKEKQNELIRKQTDLLSNLVGQQSLLIKKIEMCVDETEKLRLKQALNEMSQKTKFWIEQDGIIKKRNLIGAATDVVTATSSKEGV